MEPVTDCNWRQRGQSPPEERVSRLMSELNCRNLTAQVLASRRMVEPSAAEAFLSPRLSSLPDPLLLGGIDKAVERLCLAISRHELIVIHGDYDVDGITATTLLMECISVMGGRVDFHLPLRLQEGYGLSAEAIREAHRATAGVIVSVDCGISAHGPAQVAADLGLDLIITDHHQPPETLPQAFSIVNPHLPGDSFPYKELSGVGVAFFLMLGLRRALRDRGWFQERPEPDLRHQLDLVALGNIADIVPLTGVNRVLTAHGLELMRRNRRCGIQSLRDVAGVREISCGAVGFQIAPRLNAAGRIEDAALGVELLLCQENRKAAPLARRLDELNRDRRRIEEDTLTQALEHLENVDGRNCRGIVLADERWHPGVIGIVASRLTEKFHRPTVLIALDQGLGKGSARSIPGFHLYEALCRCSDWLEGFGGHACAAGLSIKADRIEDFAARFADLAQELVTEEMRVPNRDYDVDGTLSQLDFETVAELTRLAPFGFGNPEPVLRVRQVRACNLRPVGREHLKLSLQQGNRRIDAIAFGMASQAEFMQGELDFLCSPQVNTWQGRSNVQLRIRDFRPSA
ncbi:single-stranded-DNA-specific exonuclease RecJ [Geoalkalibacter subterraneus]|uniref:Single-stranded-DNA-specific exonuclease RecJ n=1 Tax=Geoalkalibacter subterraneus TaxID=483547 RepID=A0A0B5FQM5_9BACT|nr:single-stranded-DNA-specific exonuclease RecJ [Geoalkalibacter subterraneus]AJF06949.1 hypothetical protein GSUB_10810 [Geoalkalibacter subterraneus]